MTDMVTYATALFTGRVGPTIERQITMAWDDLAKIALDARGSYDSEGPALTRQCIRMAERELARVKALVEQAEANAPGQPEER